MPAGRSTRAAARAAAADAHAEAAHAEQELAAVSQAIKSVEAVPAPEPAPAGYFSLSELQSGCPAGVDPSHKERSLDPAAFSSVMGASPEEFAKLPKWKQSAAKKKVGLF